MTEEARLNVRVDKELLRQVRIKTIRDGTNLSRIIRDFLASYIAPPDTEREHQTK